MMTLIFTRDGPRRAAAATGFAADYGFDDDLYVAAFAAGISRRRCRALSAITASTFRFWLSSALMLTIATIIFGERCSRLAAELRRRLRHADYAGRQR